MAFSRQTTKAPQIPALTFGELSTGDPEALVGNVDVDTARFPALSVEELSIPGGRLEGCQFDGVSARTADVSGTRLIDVALDQVDVTVLRASRTQWSGVTVSGRVGSVDAYDSEWQSVHFVGCKLSYLNLRGTKLIDVAFTDCVIDELDLLGIVARRVSIEGSRVAATNIRDAELRDVDLRGGHLGTIDGIASLRGASITNDQLMDLAPQLASEL